MAQVRASHILVESEEMAQDLKNRVETGTSFEQLAKEHSKCPSGEQGGDLGWFGPGMMVPEFDQACFSMEEGTISDPIKTQFGYHLIKLTGKK